MNTVLSIIVLLTFGAVIYWFFLRDGKQDLESFATDDVDHFSEEYLKEATIDAFDEILQTDYEAFNLNKFETIKNKRNQSKLNQSLKHCSHGNISNKMYVKEYIKDLLQRRLGITPETICNVIPFDNPKALTAQDKFDILLHAYKAKYDNFALSEMIEQNGLDVPRGEGVGIYYEINSLDIDSVFKRQQKMIENLDYADFLAIVAQRVYQRSYGLGAIDDIRDMVIDGINCGTSGIPSTFYMYGADARFGADKYELPLTSYNAIWLMYHGKMINLSFLGFLTERELQRVAKLVYRYDSPGTLDADKGYIVNFMQDGSRVGVARPPFCESWVFFIRKYDAASKLPLQELYPYDGVEKLVETLRWIVSGCQNVALTGEQATGKSTLLSSLIQFIPMSFSIRVQEMAFELHLRKLYPRRNIVTFRETSTISGQEGIDFSKKTDGTTSVFGEVAQAAVATLAIQLGQVGSAQVMFTHHAKTVDDLVESFRDNMIEAAGYNNEKIVEKTVARVLNFDVHISKTVAGNRYVERITAISPKSSEAYSNDLDNATMQYYYRSTDRRIFESYDILVYRNGEYVYETDFPRERVDDILRKLSDTEKVQFRKYLERVHAEVSYE